MTEQRAHPHAGVRVTVHTAEQMSELGRRLAALLRAGDLLLLSGELGAGKTTLARGLGEGLGVRGAVTSPTFVMARVHPSLRDGPPLVHVDAYRLAGGLEEMEDLDLDAALPESVTVVEWGEDKVEQLSQDRLRIDIARSLGTAEHSGVPAGAGAPAGVEEAEPGADADPRQVRLLGVGQRWAGVLAELGPTLPGEPL